MGAECFGAQVKDDFDGIVQYPPGFAPIIFNLQKVQDNLAGPPNSSDQIQFIIEDKSRNTLQNVQHDIKTPTNSEPVQCILGDEKSRKSLRNRTFVNYRQFDFNSDEDSDYEPFEQALPSVRYVPKGVFRGCSECEHCQKVTARWRPQNASRPVLEDAPVFYPTEEEFKDTLKYIANIRPRAEQYGICRIVPPSSWRPTCLLKDKVVWENSKFATRIQQVDKLQNRGSLKKMVRSQTFMRKRRKVLKAGHSEDKSKIEANHLDDCDNSERFGFLPGPDFTLETFQKYADEFMKQYFCRNSDFPTGSCQREPSLEDIEGEYWRIVERPTEEIEVLYGADVNTGAFSSGFPRASASVTVASSQYEYANSGWNLNNFPRLPGSVLSFESGDISGVLVPWLYVGMCFSSFCWHVEDHHLYSLNYMHWGAPKIWYGVPGKDALRLEEAMKKHLPDLFKEQPDLLHNLVTQFSPSLLKLGGLPVYRCVQNEGEFVLTFPRAYHSGFNCGFNCAEAVNVAPVDWLPHGQFAVELYREQRRKISVSHDKLLLGAAREAVRVQWNILFLKKNTSDNIRWKNLCGSDGILAKALKERIETERVGREHLFSSQSGKMDASFDSDNERECVICHYDLHLSAAKCQCSPAKFACLRHAKELCSCDWTMRSFLFRYEISELNVLLDALSGKLSAVHRWGLIDLGLSLSSYVKDKAQESTQVHITNKEGGRPKYDPLVNQKSSTGDARDGSSKEFGTSKLEPLGGMKERSIKAHSLENIRCTNAAAESLQPITSTDLSAISQQSFTVGSLHHIAGSKSSNATAVASSNPLHSSDGKSNASIFQTNSKGGAETKHMSVPYLAKTEPQTCITLGAVEVKDANKLFSDKVTVEPSTRCSETLSRLMTCEDKVASCISHKDQALFTPQTNASLLSDKEISMLPVVEASSTNLNTTFLDANVQEDLTLEKDFPNLSDQQTFTLSPEKSSECAKPVNTTINGPPGYPFFVKEIHDNDSLGVHHQHPQLSGGEKQTYESKGKIESNPGCNWADRVNPVATSSSYRQNYLDRYNCQQKGPRMAKVVRRVSCNVEALEYGVVLSGKLWSTRQAIFPKGYRSRARYFSILDPTQMCYYSSEILDAGLLGPLFMVVVEQCPSEIFIHASATKCWDMVREKVNDQIRKQHNMGRLNLPPLQPPGSLDGLEMFGLSSPMIMQAIEALDRSFVCTEYWRSRSRPPPVNTRVIAVKDEGQNCKSTEATHLALTGLLKKANPDELHALQRVLLHTEVPNLSNQELIHALEEEIKNHHRPT